MIVFVGDGYDVTTNTAARIFKGQLAGEPGEETVMVWDEFPHVSLLKVCSFINRLETTVFFSLSKTET